MGGKAVPIFYTVAELNQQSGQVKPAHRGIYLSKCLWPLPLDTRVAAKL